MTVNPSNEDSTGQGVNPFAGMGVSVVVSTALGLVFGGISEGIAGGLAPVVERVGELVASEWRVRSLDQTAAMWVIASQGSDATLNELIHTARTGTAQLHIAATASAAAGTTGFPSKLVALARCLETGLRDDAQLDLEQQVVEALDRVEAPHLEVLTFLKGAIDASDDLEGAWVDRFEVAAHFTRFGPALTRILGVLSAEALIEEQRSSVLGTEFQTTGLAPTSTDQYWRCADFGVAILSRLTEAGPS